MDPINQPQDQEESNYRKIKTGVGLVLITIGVAGVVWIAERIIALGNGPQDIPLLAKFLAFDTAARTIVTASGNFELPEGFYFAIGFFLYILALGVAASLTKVLLSTGANLLGHEVASVLKGFRDEIGRLKEYLESRIK